VKRQRPGIKSPGGNKPTAKESWHRISSTDERRLDGPALGIHAIAAVYAPQGATYVRALHEALDLPQPPRFELWFLRADRLQQDPHC